MLDIFKLLPLIVELSFRVSADDFQRDLSVKNTNTSNTTSLTTSTSTILVVQLQGDSLAFRTVASDTATLLSKTDYGLAGQNEAIVLLSNEVQYFEVLETAAKIRKYIKQKNVSQLPENIQEIIRKRQAQARTLEESAKAQLEKAIVGSRFYIAGETVEIKYGDATTKLDEVLKQLIECILQTEPREHIQRE